MANVTLTLEEYQDILDRLTVLEERDQEQYTGEEEEEPKDISEKIL